MPNKLLRIALTAALAGFLFGFDTVVISGANQPIKELWQTNWFLGNSFFTFHGIFIMSMALWGTVIGAIFGHLPTNKLGRKNTLFVIGVLYFISAIGSAFAPEAYSFSFFRFIGGLGVGVSSVAAPIYITEISPAQKRGRLTALYQFNIVFGILLAFISNAVIGNFLNVQIAWRYMLGAEAVPAFIYTILVSQIPSSPRWLALKNKPLKELKNALIGIGYSPSNIETTLNQLQQNLKNSLQATRYKVFSKQYKKPLILAFLLAFFNQLSGINFVLYYAPEILNKAGLAAQASLISSIGIGAVNLLFTLSGIALIDRLGRKQLLYLGSTGYIVSLIMVAWCFKTQASAFILLLSIFVFIAAHAIGQGAIIWVFIAEIFPDKVRAKGQSWGTGTHWVFAALITLITPTFLDNEIGIFKENPWPIFIFFAAMMVLQLIWAIFKMPETKGASLEDLANQLS